MLRFISDNIAKSEVGSKPNGMVQPFEKCLEIFHAHEIAVYYLFRFLLPTSFSYVELLKSIFNTCLSFVEFNGFATVSGSKIAL